MAAHPAMPRLDAAAVVTLVPARRDARVPSWPLPAQERHRATPPTASAGQRVRRQWKMTRRWAQGLGTQVPQARRRHRRRATRPPDMAARRLWRTGALHGAWGTGSAAVRQGVSQPCQEVAQLVRGVSDVPVMPLCPGIGHRPQVIPGHVNVRAVRPHAAGAVARCRSWAEGGQLGCAGVAVRRHQRHDRGSTHAGRGWVCGRGEVGSPRGRKRRRLWLGCCAVSTGRRCSRCPLCQCVRGGGDGHRGGSRPA